MTKSSAEGKDLDVSENSGTPKSPILIGFSIINHSFWGTTIFGNTHLKRSGKSFYQNTFFLFLFLWGTSDLLTLSAKIDIT